MALITWLAAFLMLSQVQSARQFPSAEDWARADRATVRLGPAAFRDVPPAVQDELKRRGCTIPQAFTGGPAHNVVRGRFMSARGTDWAVLCSRERISSILVIPAGSPADAIELATRRDADFLQVTGSGTIGYSRAIGVASPAGIREHHLRFGGLEPPPLDHDGITDSFVEKGSVVWYWERGRWLQLTGAD